MKLPFKVDLKDKVAVVTGGTGVLGSVWVDALAKCGAKVAILSRNQEMLDKKVEEVESFGGIAIGISTDVLDKSSIQKSRKLINEKFGKCDILINGAGGNHPKGTTTKEYLYEEDLDSKSEDITFFDLSEEGLGFVMDLNFLGTFLPTQEFVKDMVGRKGCNIINISSMNAYTPLTKIPAYSGAKAAVSNLTEWLAVHLSKVGIRVNGLAPGFFLTSQNESLLLNADGSLTERSEKIISSTPMERFGEAEELVGALLFLVDEKSASFVNGVVIPIDGGFAAYSGV